MEFWYVVLSLPILTVKVHMFDGACLQFVGSVDVTNPRCLHFIGRCPTS